MASFRPHSFLNERNLEQPRFKLRVTESPMETNIVSSSATTSLAAQTTRSKAAAVLRVTSGNFLEQFDFFLFGFYATYISKVFFPTGSEFASLMLTFAVF